MKGLGIFIVAFWAVALFASAQEDSIPATKADTVRVQSDVSDSQDAIVYGHIPDQDPAFPGGEGEMLKWIREHIQYPEDCEKQGIEGLVIVSFVISRDGSIGRALTIRSPHSSLSKEAERVVKMMPRWMPAREDGRYVSRLIRLPIMFKLNNQDTKSADKRGKPKKIRKSRKRK